MQKAEIKLIALSVRTNNTEEFNPDKAKIGAVVQKYLSQDMAAKISNRKNPGVTFCAYTDYESDHTGDYTFFMGEEVTSFDNVPDDFQTLTIPAQMYKKFTTKPGPMPAVVQKAWKDIWDDKELDKKRAYMVDFEVYDERAKDLSNVVMDIYIGVK